MEIARSAKSMVNGCHGKDFLQMLLKSMFGAEFFFFAEMVPFMIGAAVDSSVKSIDIFQKIAHEINKIKQKIQRSMRSNYSFR